MYGLSEFADCSGGSGCATTDESANGATVQ